MNLRSTHGFSLIEVMIALVILAGLSVLTAQSMRSGLESREAVSADLDRESKVTDAITIMRGDIASAFHHRDLTIRMLNEIAKTPTPAAPTPGPDGFIPPPPIPTIPAAGATPVPTPRPTPKVVTAFVGTSESIYFTTTSNARTLRDSPESDQAKVGYFLQNCQTTSVRTGQPQSSNCLMRATSPFLDEDVTKIDGATILVENVQEFKLRYLGPGHDDYVDAWKSTKDGDQTTKGNFPIAVEITLTAQDKSNPKDKAVTASALVPLRFPNNRPKKTPNPNAPAGTSPNAGDEG